MDLLHSIVAQQAAYHTLEVLRVFPCPRSFAPMLAGTIPRDIGIAGSDHDMACSVERGHHGGIR
jgi:hypothetical protein